jgi:hypothetical protein
MKKIETDNDGRVRIDNSVMALLKPIPNGNYYKQLPLLQLKYL